MLLLLGKVPRFTRDIDPRLDRADQHDRMLEPDASPHEAA